jgi:chromosome segregation ATPase
MKNYKLILTALLVGITVFAIVKYILTLKEKNDLVQSLNQTQTQVSTLQEQNQKLFQTLEQEKQQRQAFAQENTGLKDNLKAAQDELTRISTTLDQAQKTIDQLNAEAAVLKTENISMKERLGSIKELKKAIREVKIKIYQARVEMRQKSDVQRLLEGNRGFVLKDGKPTYPAKVRIQVNPAQ